MSAAGPPGFDLERRSPACPACSEVRGSRRWTCRLCGVAVCDHEAPAQYVDGGCRCRDCERWHGSLVQVNARLARLGLSPVAETTKGETP